MITVPYSALGSNSPPRPDTPQKDTSRMKNAVLAAFLLAAAATAVLIYSCVHTQRNTTERFRFTQSSYAQWRAGLPADSSACRNSSSRTAAATLSLTKARPSWEIDFNVTQKIPLKLWQTSRDWNLSAKTQKAMATWRKLNPSLPVALHSDTTAAQFIKQFYGKEVYDVYQSFPLGVMRADFWRYAILYAHGGIYADIDAQCVQPISSWFPPRKPHQTKDYAVFVHNGSWKSAGGLDHYQLSWWDCSIVIGLENSLHVCNWAMASVPGHPILKEVIQRAVRKAQQGFDFSDLHFVHNHTGPGIWTEAVAEVLGLPSQQVSDSGARIAAAVWTDPETYRLARSMGVCIVAAPFFGGATDAPQNVQNLFGSLHFDTGYPKWVDEREKLLQAVREQAAAAANESVSKATSSDGPSDRH